MQAHDLVVCAKRNQMLACLPSSSSGAERFAAKTQPNATKCSHRQQQHKKMPSGLSLSFLGSACPSACRCFPRTTKTTKTTTPFVRGSKAVLKGLLFLFRFTLLRSVVELPTTKGALKFRHPQVAHTQTHIHTRTHHTHTHTFAYTQRPLFTFPPPPPHFGFPPSLPLSSNPPHAFTYQHIIPHREDLLRHGQQACLLGGQEVLVVQLLSPRSPFRVVEQA